MKYIYLFLMILFVASCKHNKVNEPQTLILKASIEPTKVSIYDLFDSIQVIPLETTDSCLLTGPVELITTTHAYYLLDWNHFQVFVFDIDGHFSHTIGRRGQGPGEYSQVYDVIIDENRNLVRMISPFGSIYNYDLSGKFINEVYLPAKANYQKIEEIDSCTIVTWSVPLDSKDPCITILDVNTGKEKKTMWKGPRILNASLVSVFYTYNSHLYFTPTFDNNRVYEIVGDSLRLVFQWDFGKDNLDMSQYGFTFTDQNRHEESLKLDQYLKEGRIPYRLSYQYENERYRFIHFLYNYLSTKKTFFYRKKDGKCFMFDRTEEGIRITFPIDFTEQYLAFVAPGGELASYKNVLSAAAYEKLQFRSEDDNPCLVKLYFK